LLFIAKALGGPKLIKERLPFVIFFIQATTVLRETPNIRSSPRRLLRSSEARRISHDGPLGRHAGLHVLGFASDRHGRAISASPWALDGCVHVHRFDKTDNER
jgi:hypothetical protein